MSKPETLTIRLSQDLRVRADAVMSIFPYRITMTSLVERGIELAIAELRLFNPQAADEAIKRIIPAEGSLFREEA